MSTIYEPARCPRMYFIGVSTGQSSMMKIFPRWAEFLGIADAELKGIDFPLNADPAAYRVAVEFIKQDSLTRGALVTTHKLNLFAACRDLFNEVDAHAARLCEASAISKSDGKLVAHATDPISSGLALDAFLPPGYWRRTGAEVFLLGAGGASVATSWHLMCSAENSNNRPSRIVVTDRNASRLQEMQHLHNEFGAGLPVDYLRVDSAEENDAVAARLRPGSLVANATGLGKDTPGSPLTDGAIFPEHGYVWEFNYRGDLLFLRQARAQQEERHLRVEDGWIYFIHGWIRVIAEVFHLDIPVKGERFDRLSEIARNCR